MGKSLLELLELKNANAAPVVTPKPIIPSEYGDVIKKYVGEEIYTREEKNAAQTINFIKNVPKIYGLDAKRILLQRDPHADKVIVKKAAAAIGGLLGPFGAAAGKFLANFNPKYPDDFLVGDPTTEPTFNLYSKLLSSDYAGGKYYNGGVKNSKSKLAQFLQANRTPQQIKDNAVAAAKTMIIGAAIAGVKKLLTKKKRKEDPSKKLPPPVPFFPSTLVLNSNQNPAELIAYNQEQQRRSSQFPSKFGKDFGITSTIVSDTPGGPQKRNDELASLDTLYSNHIELYLRKNNDTDTRELYDNYGYYTSLTINNGVEDSYKRVGRYSKDVLRIFEPSDNTNGVFVPEKWDRYSTIKEFEDAEPYWDNLIPTKGLLRFGTDNASSLELGGQINLQTSYLDNWLSYNPIGEVDYSKYWIKPVRWNSREAKYSDQAASGSGLNTILDQDYYFASQSFQSQANAYTKKYNPYLKQRRDVLDTSKNDGTSKNDKAGDIIKFKIGSVKLLATLSGLTDATTPSWSDIKGVGSGFSFYGYDKWEREISFKFRLYAESEQDLKDIWKKANFIKQYTLPQSKGSLGVYGKIISLQIGDLINEEYGFISLCEVSVLDESPWEITEGLQKPFVFDINITYRVVKNQDNFDFYKPQTNDKAYEIKTKPETIQPVVIGAAPQFNTQTDDQLDSSLLRTTDTSTVNRERTAGMSSVRANGGRELNRTPTDITPNRVPDASNQKFEGPGESTFSMKSGFVGQ